MKKVILSMVVACNIILAKEGISLTEIFKSNFSNSVTVGQKLITLTKSEIALVQKEAKATIDSNKIRFYVVKNADVVEGYGVMVIERVRTKMAAILYLIDKDEKIKNIEIIAFHEPSEYKPNSNWKKVFEGKGTSDDLRAGYGIPTVTGATLSSRAVANAARIALAIVAREK